MAPILRSSTRKMHNDEKTIERKEDTTPLRTTRPTKLVKASTKKVKDAETLEPKAKKKITSVRGRKLTSRSEQTKLHVTKCSNPKATNALAKENNNQENHENASASLDKDSLLLQHVATSLRNEKPDDYGRKPDKSNAIPIEASCSVLTTKEKAERSTVKGITSSEIAWNNLKKVQITSSSATVEEQEQVFDKENTGNHNAAPLDVDALYNEEQNFSPSSPQPRRAIKRHLGTPLSARIRQKRQPDRGYSPGQKQDTLNKSKEPVHCVNQYHTKNYNANVVGQGGIALLSSDDSPTKRGRLEGSRNRCPPRFLNSDNDEEENQKPEVETHAQGKEKTHFLSPTSSSSSLSGNNTTLPTLLNLPKVSGKDWEDDVIDEDLDLLTKTGAENTPSSSPSPASSPYQTLLITSDQSKTALKRETNTANENSELSTTVTAEAMNQHKVTATHDDNCSTTDNHHENALHPLNDDFSEEGIQRSIRSTTPIKVATPIRQYYTSPKKEEIALATNTHYFELLYPIPNLDDKAHYLTLPLSTRLAALTKHFSGLEEAIHQRRQRRYPLLFSTAPEQSDGSSLQKHVELLTHHTFNIQTLRQIAWIAPHLIDLRWSLARGPQDKRRIWDIEIQQRPFSIDGPIIMYPLKQQDISRRQLAFRVACLRWLEIRHTQFLQTSNPAIPSIPLEKISQWHPNFDLENDTLPVPCITLPERPLPQSFVTSTSPGPFQTLLQKMASAATRATTPPPSHFDCSDEPRTPKTSRWHTNSPDTTADIQSDERDGSSLPGLLFNPSNTPTGRTLLQNNSNNKSVSTPKQSSTPLRFCTPVRNATPIRYATPVRNATPVRTPPGQNRYATPVRNPTPIRPTSPSYAIQNRSTNTTTQDMLASPFPSRQRKMAELGTTPGQQRLLERARDREYAKNLETMLEKELAGFEREIEEVEDALACFESIVCIFFKTTRPPLAQLEAIAPKVIDTIGDSRPGMTPERVSDGLVYISENTEGVITLRDSKIDRKAKIMQFHKSANISAEKAKLLKKLEQARERAEHRKRQAFEDFSQLLHPQLESV